MIEVEEVKTIGDSLFVFGRATGTIEELTPGERRCISPRASAKRIADFVAGRLLGREALQRRFGQGDWSIERVTNGLYEGAPIVIGPARVELSLSHVDGHVAVVVAPKRAAVDLVRFETLSEAFTEEVFTEAERLAWAAAPCVGFAAKEAALKWLRVGMGVPLQSLTVVPAGLGMLSVRYAGQCEHIPYQTVRHDEWLSFVLTMGQP